MIGLKMADEKKSSGVCMECLFITNGLQIIDTLLITKAELTQRVKLYSKKLQYGLGQYVVIFQIHAIEITSEHSHNVLS